MRIDFTGKKALVTGGTRGIGKQVALQLCGLGADVTITGTKETSFAAGADFNTQVVDFLDENSTNQFLEHVQNAEYDVCINNAGINKIDPLAKVDEKDWQDIIQVNLTTPFKICQAVSEGMKKKKYGRIVNISSIWGTISIAQRAAYSSSKFGLRGLTLAAAAELAQHNILVNTVSPGFTLTDLTREVLSAQVMEEIAETIPMRRMANVEEVGKAILFMVSDLNTYISGHNLVVDGGYVNV